MGLQTDPLHLILSCNGVWGLLKSISKMHTIETQRRRQGSHIALIILLFPASKCSGITMREGWNLKFQWKCDEKKLFAFSECIYKINQINIITYLNMGAFENV